MSNQQKLIESINDRIDGLISRRDKLSITRDAERQEYNAEIHSMRWTLSEIQKIETASL